jgi:hypothetical protein
MVLVFALSLMGMQATRLQLIESAAIAARAIARGEPQPQVNELISAVAESNSMKVMADGDLVCVEVKVQREIFWLGRIELQERQCSRNQGL